MEIKEVTEKQRKNAEKINEMFGGTIKNMRMFFSIILFIYIISSFIIDIYLFSTQYTLGTNWLNVPFLLTFSIGFIILIDETKHQIKKIKNRKTTQKTSGCSKCGKNKNNLKK